MFFVCVCVKQMEESQVWKEIGSSYGGFQKRVHIMKVSDFSVHLVGHE